MLFRSELGEDTAEGAGIEFIFGQRLVHALGTPADASGIERLIGDNGRFDGGEVEVTDDLGSILHEMTEGL